MNLERVLATSRNALLIGVDGGASGFRAYEIVVEETERGPRLALGTHGAAEDVEPVTGFVSVDIERQREQARASKFEFTREERTLQGRWIHAASRAIWRVAVLARRDTVRVGICAPGVKTQDMRGIAISLNGPRIPDFADALEQSLVLDGLNLADSIAHVFSDGLACGFGEELSVQGAFANVAHAYYLGGGSGVAECYKLAGKIVSADELAPAIPKAWQMQARDGRTFEAHLSAAGLNRDFGVQPARSDQEIVYPEAAAASGDARALQLFRTRAESLAELCASRAIELHKSHGIVLERIVIGQRLGQLFLDPRVEDCFRRPALAALRDRLNAQAPSPLREIWITNRELAPDRLVGSRLRSAAALGALALELGAGQA